MATAEDRQDDRPMTEQKKHVDWKTLAAEQAQALGLSPDDLKQEVQRELMARLAKQIADRVLKNFDWRAAGMTSEVTF